MDTRTLHQRTIWDNLIDHSLLQRIPSALHKQSSKMSSDLSMVITSPNSSSERRISPSWTIAVLKRKLESVTGVPPESQRLILGDLLSSSASLPLTRRDPDTDQEDQGDVVVIQADSDKEEERVTLNQWRLRKGMEIHVS